MVLLNACSGRYYQKQAELQHKIVQEQVAAMKAQLEFYKQVHEKDRKEIDSLKSVIDSLRLK